VSVAATKLHPGVSLVQPGSFEPSSHFYPRVINAHIHPLVRYFMDLGNARIAERYTHLHPEASKEAVKAALALATRHFRWGGADLFHTTTERGQRRIVVIETNSCPSGNKSMPLLVEREEQAGYRVLLENALAPLLKSRTLPAGEVAVLYDKNLMEASAYAAVLSDIIGQPVLLVEAHDEAVDPTTKCDDGVILVKTSAHEWTPLRAALRYVTQRPWNRIPPITRTAMFNPVLVCLAGGRNKALAARAYDLFNGEMGASGLAIRTPETIWNVSKEEVPLWVQRMGGFAVVKVPYSNAGQGVFTITRPCELEEFMDREHPYDSFVIQALIGNVGWSSRGRRGRLYHVGTVPNRAGHIHASDLRFMVGNGPNGFFPVAIYARRARLPLAPEFAVDREAPSSWDMLGTNLSNRQPDGSWTSDTERLMLMDSRDFNRLGLGLDDLTEAYLQTVFAVTAIDRMANNLVTQKGKFRYKLFQALNPDRSLVDEIVR
jgi:hypothetical protein